MTVAALWPAERSFHGYSGVINVLSRIDINKL